MCDTCPMLILDRDLALNHIIWKSQQLKVPPQFIRARPEPALLTSHAERLGDEATANVLALDPAALARSAA